MTVLAIVIKSTALLAVAAGITGFMGRRGSAAARHMVWTIAMAGLLALPVASMELPRVTVRVPVAPPVAVEAVRLLPQPHSTSSAALPTSVPSPSPQNWPSGPLTTATAVVAAYILGVGVFLARLASEQLALVRIVRGSNAAVDSRLRAALDEAARDLGIDAPIRLLQSGDDVMPMTFGTWRRTVVLPASANAWTAARVRAVLLHELAHVARLDCLTQMLAAFTCAFYWPHAGVWWAARRLRAEREHACDDRVLAAGTPPRDYAGHLLDIAHTLGASPAPGIALGMARARQLENRLLAVLDAARNRSVIRRRVGVVAAIVAVAIVLPVAALTAGRVPAREETGPFATRQSSAAKPASTNVADLTGTWEVRPSRQAGVVQVSARTAHGSHSETVPADRVEAIAGQRIPTNGPVHFTVQREAGTFTGEGVCRSSVCGGTFGFEPNASFAAELARRGIGTPTPEDQLSLAIADVGLKYIDGIIAAGYSKPDVQTLVRAARHGVSIDYVQSMARLGYRLGTLDPLIRMRDHGVDPAFAEGLAANGFAHLTAEDLVRARDHGVDPEYIKGMRAIGLSAARIDDFIRTRDHGVDPEYASGMASVGYKGVAVDELVRSRDHGVDPEYVRALAELGYRDTPLDTLIRMRDHGVDAAYVQGLKQRGITGLSPEELIRRRDRGTDDPSVQARETLASIQAWWHSLSSWWPGFGRKGATARTRA